MKDLRYETLMGRGPKKIVHWEHWSNPDAATYISGIDFYKHPRMCIQKINKMYPFVYLSVPADSPLANADFSYWDIPEAGDYRDEETIYKRFRNRFPVEWTEDHIPEGFE